MSPNSEHPFFYYHLRAVLLTALAFGLTHGGQMLVVGFIRDNSLSIKLSALFTTLVFETIQSLVFVVVGLVVSYIPSRILSIALRKSSASKRPLISIATGTLLGILFLPLCASFSFFLLHEPNAPSYTARYAEFALPMIIAGGFGGYGLWRFGGEIYR